MPKLAIYDQRMFLLMDHVIGNKIKGIDNLDKFMKAVGVPSGGSLAQVRQGKQSFRLDHFLHAAKLFNISMDWFMGFSDQMARSTNGAGVEDLLLEAIVQLRAKKKSL